MQIIILGMHRSGTSLAAMTLSQMGLFFGEQADLLPPDEDNPAGFWERQDVLRLNRKVLRRCRCRWDMVSGFDPARVGRRTMAMFRQRANEIVGELNRHGQWGVKEPRMCVALPLWTPLLDRPACVFVIRHPADVARSLERRNGIPVEAGLALWELYNIRALDCSRAMPRMTLLFDDLVGKQAETSERIGTWLRALGGSVRETASPQTSVVQPSLIHHRSGSSDRAIALSPAQSDLWEAFRSGASPESSPQQVSDGAMDRLHAYEQTVLRSMPFPERVRLTLRVIQERF